MIINVSFLRKKLMHTWKHEGFQKYFKSTSWLLLEKFFRLFTGLFIGIWVARYLGPEDYGLYNYVISFAGLFTVVATLGLDSVVVKELINHPEKRDSLLGTSFVLKLLGSLFILFFLYLTLLFIGKDFLQKFLIYIVALTAIFQSFDILNFYFQAKILSKYISISNVLSIFLSAVIKVVLIILNANLVYFVYLILFDSVVLIASYFYFYNKQGLSLLNWRFEKLIAKKLLLDGWPLVLSGIFISIYMRIDQIMLKNMLGNEFVGYYSVAVRLSEIWYFIPVVISSSFFPAILNAKKVSEAVYYDRIKKIYRLVIYFSFLVSALVTIFSGPMVRLLYGHEYSPAVIILQVYTWSSIFVGMGVISSNWLIAEGYQVLSFVRTFLGAILNIILNFILIGPYGVVGAAISTLISYSFSAYLFDLFNKKTRPMFFLKTKALWF